MVVEVETLDKLERKVTLSLSVADIHQEVTKRLQNMARKAKMDGFRPGKVPLKVVTERYAASVRYEVVNAFVGKAFDSAVKEAGLNVAGILGIEESAQAQDTSEALHFTAKFEVFPEVELPELENLELEKLSTTVDESAITRTVAFLRKQRATFAQRPLEAEAADTDKATIDFEGKVDGEVFEGGKAEEFQFQLGEKQMLPEFEAAVLGMKVGESRTFPVHFPENYQSKEVAGKKADFWVSLRKLESQNLPEVNEAFVKTLGVSDGNVETLHADIRKNLEREVSIRLSARNRSNALNALADKAQLLLPQTAVRKELEQLLATARTNLKNRGVKDSDSAPIPEDMFQPQAERRVRLGLVLRKLVESNDLDVKPEQISQHIESIAMGYEKPVEVIQWYGKDEKRMAEIKALLLEDNVVDFIFSKAKVSDKPIELEALMQAAA